MMTRILLAFILAVFGTLSVGAENADANAEPDHSAQATVPDSSALKLAEGAPSRYVVVRGDTLWDISAKFLRDPWRWPEIWRMNQESIKDPHWIYPGDIILLDRDANGDPLLRLISGTEGSASGSGSGPDARYRRRSQLQKSDAKQLPQIYEEMLAEIIPPIPPHVIEPFIVTPLFTDDNMLDAAPRIVATQENRVFLGKGDTAYVRGADPEQREWQIFRKGRPVYDPEDEDHLLGYEAFHLGSAQQLEAGNPAVFEIDSAKQEIGYGDRLTPAIRPRLIDYVPHAPAHDIDGRIVSVYGGLGSGGRLSIVMINRGNRAGLEIGHVLALERNRIVQQRDDEDNVEEIVIPAKRFGLLFVFRTFENVAYALAVQSDGIIEVNDFVRTP